MIWIFILSVIVLAGVVEQRNDELRDAGAYTASRRQLRAWRKERLAFNDPRVWRRG